MSYTALYRKFRPATFKDVKGQDSIVRTLENQIKAQRIGHAFLFCGTRGTGKTSSALILAKAVNCEHPVDGNPCGECEMCKKIAAGTSMNVIEIDAASNNGVDNIRQIVDEVRYSPTEGKYKVYIIDEVHMLSAGAFNALLKTLEEPPSYVIFILATTEVNKIPITILSRCQRYDFRRISTEEITDRLTELVEAEGIKADKKALRYIATVGDGSLRDSISLLDQCVAFYLGSELTYDKVLEVLGTVDISVFGNMMKDIRSSNVAGCLKTLDEIVIRGRELTQFTKDFTWYLRNLLVAKASETMIDSLDIPTDCMAAFKEEVAANTSEDLVRYIRVMSELTNNIRFASQKRVIVEVTLIKLCCPQMEDSYDSLIQRVEKVEQAVENGVFVSKKAKTQTSMEEEPDIEEVPKELPKALTSDLREIAANWDRIKSSFDMPLRAYLENSKPSVGENNVLLLVSTSEVDKIGLESEQHMNELKNVIADVTGKSVDIEVTLAKGRQQEIYPDLQELMKKVPVDFTD